MILVTLNGVTCWLLEQIIARSVHYLTPIHLSSKNWDKLPTPVVTDPPTLIRCCVLPEATQSIQAVAW